MPTSIQLDISWDWWRWRGYREEDCWQSELMDAMDQSIYDESTAFPTMKPNFDVFGPPRRSRKQRGWYQIRDRSSGSSTHSTEVFATGADVPPELIDRMLNELAPGYLDAPPSPSTKHALAMCALVCRYWVAKCRRRLFRWILPRSSADIDYLRTLERSPQPVVSTDGPLIDHVRVLRVRLQGDDMSSKEKPWLHTMSLIDRELWIELVLEGPLPKRLGLGNTPFKSIHHRLPRSLPHFSKNIKRLELVGIRLASLDHIMHLVGELPHLWKLCCTDVTWETAPKRLLQRRRSANQQSVHEVCMERCGPAAPVAAMYLSLSMVHRAVPFFSRDDMCATLGLVQKLPFCTTECDNCNVLFGMGLGLHCYSPDDVHFRLRVKIPPPSTLGEIELGFRSSSKIKSEGAPRTSTDSLSGDLLNIHLISFKIPHFDSVWAAVEWNSIDTILFSFPCLHVAVFGFPSREHLLRFWDSAEKRQMPLMIKHGITRYAIEQWNSFGVRRWFRTSPNSDDLEASGQCDLYHVYLT